MKPMPALTLVKKLLISSLFAAVMAANAWADRELDGDKSTIAFQSIKKGQVIETHHFKKMSGKLTDDGQVEIDVDLNSVDTKIPVRDERMREMLFQTAKYADAKLTAKVDTSVEPGEIKVVETDAKLDLHGFTNTVKVKAMVTDAGEQLVVSSVEPVIVNAADFKLDTGIEALREVAKLPSITLSSPVTFNLVFK